MQQCMCNSSQYIVVLCMVPSVQTSHIPTWLYGQEKGETNDLMPLAKLEADKQKSTRLFLQRPHLS